MQQQQIASTRLPGDAAAANVNANAIGGSEAAHFCGWGCGGVALLKMLLLLCNRL